MYTIARHFVSPIAARYTDNIVFLAYSLIAVEFFPAISFPGRRQSAIAAHIFQENWFSNFAKICCRLFD